MLEGLRTRPFVGRDDEQEHVHPGRAGEHVVQEALVPRHVDDAGFDAVVKAQVREAQVERHAAHLLFEPPSGFGAGQRPDERHDLP